MRFDFAHSYSAYAFTPITNELHYKPASDIFLVVKCRAAQTKCVLVRICHCKPLYFVKVISEVNSDVRFAQVHLLVMNHTNQLLRLVSIIFLSCPAYVCVIIEALLSWCADCSRKAVCLFYHHRCIINRKYQFRH